MLTQLLILLTLCHQVDVQNPKISTTLVCEHDNHTLVIWWYLDGKPGVELDGTTIFFPHEERNMCVGQQDHENHVYR